MLNVVTVQVGNYCGRGSDYLTRLFSGFDSHLPKGKYKYHCITDDPGKLPCGVAPIEAPQDVSGWWNKIALFKPGSFPKGERVLFSDLDAMIIGSLEQIVAYQGTFAAIRDFYNLRSLQSCLMAWEAGTCDHIWQAWEQSGRPQFDPKGDQAFIEAMRGKADYWQDMLPGQIVSFKDCQKLGGVLPTARIVCFHGRPRPHEVNFDLSCLKFEIERKSQ
jgi:hypothetical protein